MGRELITTRQKQVLSIIYNWIKSSGFPPSFNELKDELDISSNQTILDHLANLEKKKLIKREEGSARGIKILSKGYGVLGVNQLIPVVGTTAAGSFIEAIEEMENWEELSQEVAKLNDDLMIVKVSGDSMINAGINDGDFVLIKRTNSFKKGDIVLAQDSDGTTLKRIIFERGKYLLKAENPKYEKIELSEETEIIGILEKKYLKENLLKDKESFNVLIRRPNGNGKTPYSTTDLFAQKKIDLPITTDPLVLVGDVIEKLRLIPDKSISVVVTSPPYWNLRDYETDGQIGREKNPKDYIEKIVNVGDEILRVLKDNGAYFLNIGDTYVDKNLQMIPQRVAIEMQNRGWLLRNQIIWHKPDHMPSPVKSRFTNTYEPIYFFTKNDWEKRVHFDIDSVRVPHKTENIQGPKRQNYNGKFLGNEKNIGASPGARMSISEPKYTLKRKVELPQNLIADYLKKWRIKSDLTVKQIDKLLSYTHTAGHWFRKDAGGSLPLPEDWEKLKEILKFDNKYDKEMTETELVLQVVRNHPNGKNPGDLWEINTAKNTFAHFAVFPEEIPRMAIKSCCPPNGIVLDPFAGSGTTGRIAKELNRKSILIEIQDKYLDIIKKRCGKINIIK